MQPVPAASPMQRARGVEDSDEWDEWAERLTAAEQQVWVSLPLIQEQLALATKYRKHMRALRALADDLDRPDAHARWVRLSDVRQKYDVRFANSTVINMAAGVRSSWAAFVNSCVMALARTFAGVEEGTIAVARDAVARYLDSGGAHYEATRRKLRSAEGTGTAPTASTVAPEVHAEREAASAVVSLLNTHVVRPHVLEAKAALCLWSNTLNALVAALTDYELSVGRLPPTTTNMPHADVVRHVDAVRRWCSRTDQQGRASAFEAVSRDGVQMLADVTHRPAGSLETRAASAAMVVVARWAATKRAGQRTAALRGPASGRAARQRAAEAQQAQNEHNLRLLACWMEVHEAALLRTCSQEKHWAEGMIEAAHTSSVWHAAAVHEDYRAEERSALAAALQPPNHLGAFRNRARVVVGCALAASGGEDGQRPVRTVPVVQLCAVVQAVLENGHVSFGCVSAAYLLEAAKMDYATHETKLLQIRADLRRLLPQSERIEEGALGSVWYGISPRALTFR